MKPSILVTGAGTGFGPEISLYLAERGFAVYAGVQDISVQADLETAAARRGVTLRVVPLDVADQRSVDAAVQTLVGECGGIDGVVSNATMLVRGYFEDLRTSEIQRVFDINFFGAMALTRAALPHMRAARGGRIVIISSVAGRIGSPSGSAYSASRFAQEGFAESLYQEVKPLGIGVSLIEPGITRTGSWTIDRCAAEDAQNPSSPYYASFREAERLFDRAMQTAPQSPADVAAAVHQALTDRRPRLRYVVGRRSGLIMALRRYVPGEAFDRFYFGQVMRRVARPQ